MTPQFLAARTINSLIYQGLWWIIITCWGFKKRNNGAREVSWEAGCYLKAIKARGSKRGSPSTQRSRARAVTHHLVQRGHQDAQGGERHPQNAELHVVVGVEENTQRDGDLWRGTRRF